MTLSFQPDDDADLLAKLLPYATDVQANYVEAIRVHGSGKAAARALGVSGDTVNKSIRALRRMGALKGVAPECGMTESVPDGFRLKGRSVLRKLDPVTGQKVEVLAWDKISADDERRAEMIKEWVEHLTVGCRGLSPIVPAPAYTMKSLLVSYKFGDPHFGMCSAPEDGGDTFDVDEADRITRAGIDRLVQVSPASSTCIVEVIGDAMHANDGSALTPGHKNPLDIDPRGFRYALLKSAEAWRYVILRALEKHDKVIVWFLEGNHDPEAAGAIASTTRSSSGSWKGTTTRKLLARSPWRCRSTSTTSRAWRSTCLRPYSATSASGSACWARTTATRSRWPSCRC